MSDSIERDALKDILTASVKEQRAARRWGIFFKLLTFSYLFLMLALFMGWVGNKEAESASTGPHTAVVDLKGEISAGSDASSDIVLAGLKAAFEDSNTKAVILRANSPGGSPVQSGLMYDEIVRLKKMHPKTPFYVVVEDVCASGCYYTAVSADKIFADKASIVGSIGVLMDGFGFTGAMEKLGVERRLMTAGANKGFLDPFSPQSEAQKEKALAMLAEIHQQFISVVKQGRGKRLAQDNPDLFSGLVWSGESGLKLGLVDALGSVNSVARDVVKVPNVVDFTPQPSYADRLARQLGVAAATTLGAKMEFHLK
ncbi:S49 family peptidase [Chitinibacter bivalviorum]|uniref:S49 family peptidase n=1 Tax=Chitinibacter bivalviorum TaxID=2739434 RepID=A0A7H9BMH7_9NEIS|nr:S49 family peptidase [Chitinibacter bivalviorum]QLG89765.1 S49 family peptidase [Chitinibacter bivalviorum]